MTKEELIARALRDARHTYKISHHIGIGYGEALVLRAAFEAIHHLIDALEVATTNSELTVEYGRKNRLTGEVCRLNGKPFSSWWEESQKDYLHVQRTVGPWEVVE